MNRAELILKNLIEKAENYSDFEFRLLLEKFLEREGEEGEAVFISYMLDKKLSVKTKMNLIRVAGYRRSPKFLIPLKTIAEREVNVNLQKEAIIAISKYNDKKALNILSLFLERNSNSNLDGLIKNEISKIKQNNPVLGLLPKLVDPNIDKKSLKNILSVLKRIVGPSEAKLFLPYLNIKNREVLKAIYEILCYSADKSLRTTIREKFKEFYKEIPCKTHIKCDTFYELFLPYSNYIKRNPDLSFVKELEELFNTSQDERILDIIISLLSSFPYEEAVNVLSTIYEKKEAFREKIIKGLKGNSVGVDLIIKNFEKVKEDTSASLKSEMLKSLLSTEKGVSYLKQKFSEFEDIDKIMILKDLSSEHYNNFRGIILDSFTSDDIRIKKAALKKFEENYDFSIESLIKKEILYASSHIEKELLGTVKKLFPLFLFYYIFYYIVEKKPSLKRSIEILEFVKDISVFEPVLLGGKNGIEEYLPKSIELISKNPSKTLLTLFFSLFSKLKFWENDKIKTVEEMFDKIVKEKGQKLSSDEKLELKRVKENLGYIKKDLKNIGEGKKYLEIFFKNPSNLNYLMKVFLDFPLTAYFERKKILKTLNDMFEKEGENYFKNHLSYFEKNKYISYQLFSDKKDKLLYFNKDKVSPQKIGLLFNNKSLLPIFRDQLLLFFDDLKILIDTYEGEDDILIMDSQFYLSRKEEFINRKKIIIILSDLKDSSLIENKFAKMFLKQFSLYRILKTVIEELF